MSRRAGLPVLVGSGPLAPLHLQATAGVTYDEAWLQDLLHEHPAVVPIGQVEPGFSDLIPVCRELPLTFGGGRTGSLDNLLVTAEGGLVLIEAKLWRDPEARRKVVAQALDYAAAVFALGYEGLDAACRKARGDPTPLAEVIRAAVPDGFDEAAFVDALTLALRRGRAVVAVVGDGIREDVEALDSLLGVYALADGRHLVVPSTLARTVLIERGVVRIEEGTGARVVVTPPAVATGVPSAAAPTPRVGSLTEDAFLEAVDARDPDAGRHLREFLALAEECGFHVDVQRTLIIKHASGEARDFNLGYIDRGLLVEAGPSSWFGRLEPGRRYCQRLATLTGGLVWEGVAQGKPVCSLRTADGRTPRLSDLLPRHRDAWLAAMADYVAEQREEDP